MVESENLVHIPTVARLALDSEQHSNDDVTTATVMVSDSGTPRLTSTLTITFIREHHRNSKSTTRKFKVFKMKVGLFLINIRILRREMVGSIGEAKVFRKKVG